MLTFFFSQVWPTMNNSTSNLFRLRVARPLRNQDGTIVQLLISLRGTQPRPSLHTPTRAFSPRPLPRRVRHWQLAKSINLLGNLDQGVRMSRVNCFCPTCLSIIWPPHPSPGRVFMSVPYHGAPYAKLDHDKRLFLSSQINMHTKKTFFDFYTC